MLTGFQWFSIIIILACTFLGGFMPLFHPEKARLLRGFPRGQAFSAGVFLALSLTMMLPSAFHLFSHAFPALDFPLAAVIAILAFLLLLFLEHTVDQFRQSKEEDGARSPIIPIIMTFMIAVPSFLSGNGPGHKQDRSGCFHPYRHFGAQIVRGICAGAENGQKHPFPKKGIFSLHPVRLRHAPWHHCGTTCTQPVGNPCHGGGQGPCAVHRFRRVPLHEHAS